MPTVPAQCRLTLRATALWAVQCNEPPLETDEEGFGQRGGNRIPWSLVRRIVAFKLDLLTTDELRIRVETDNGVLVLEASEEQDGFDAFLTQLERRFALLPDWRRAVLVPAFARGEIALYPKPGELVATVTLLPSERGGRTMALPCGNFRTVLGLARENFSAELRLEAFFRDEGWNVEWASA